LPAGRDGHAREGSDLLSYRLQGWGLALQRDLPALGPEDLLWSGRTPGTDFHGKPFAGAEELQGYAKTEGSLEVRVQGQRGIAALKCADAIVERRLASRSLAHNPDGDTDQNEVTVGRKFTRLRPILLYLENTGLLGTGLSYVS
jgi:hypothetical protein